MTEFLNQDCNKKWFQTVAQLCFERFINFLSTISDKLQPVDFLQFVEKNNLNIQAVTVLSNPSPGI